MRVLVTGGTGFVGSHSVAAIRAAGHDVRLLVRDPDKAKRVSASRGLDADDLVVGDVTDAACVDRALEGCDAVVHAAALVALEAARGGEVLATNARGVELVVGGAVRRGVRSIVYVSSGSALFTPGSGPIAAGSAIADGKSAYARSKADSERIVQRLIDAGAPIRSTYPPGIIGPDDPGLSEGNHTIRTFLRDTMVITSSGFQVVDVRDLAAVHVALLEPHLPAGRYTIGGPMLEWAALVELIDELTGRRVRRFRIPGPVLRGLGRIGDLVKRVRPFDFPLTREGMQFATRWPGILASPALDSLGVRFREARETYADTIRWLHRAGHLTSEQAGRLAEP
jgi:nucleoside-diphosphate-sugar epimerase